MQYTTSTALRVLLTTLALTSALTTSTSTSTPTATSTASAFSTTIPALASLLPFVPYCAHYCLGLYLPPISSTKDLKTVCDTWEPGPDNNNTAIAAATSSPSKVLALIGACVYEWCGRELEAAPAFQEALSGACSNIEDDSAPDSEDGSAVDKKNDSAAEATAEPSTDDSESAGDKPELGPGIISGIVIAVVAGLTLVVVAVLQWRRRKLKKKDGQEARSTPDLEKSCSTTSSSNTASPYLPSHGFDFGVQPAPAWSPGSPVQRDFDEVPRLPVMHAHSPLMEEEEDMEDVKLEDEGVEEVGAAVEEEDRMEEEDRVEEGNRRPSCGGIARADSVAWRRSLQDAAERAAVRVSLRVSEPILEDAPVGRGDRRSSRGGSTGRRWSYGGGMRP